MDHSERAYNPAMAFVEQRGDAVVVRLPAAAARVWDLSRILPTAT